MLWRPELNIHVQFIRRGTTRMPSHEHCLMKGALVACTGGLWTPHSTALVQHQQNHDLRLSVTSKSHSPPFHQNATLKVKHTNKQWLIIFISFTDLGDKLLLSELFFSYLFIFIRAKMTITFTLRKMYIWKKSPFQHQYGWNSTYVLFFP